MPLVVREACGACHLETIQAAERSIMATGAMLFNGASYNNGLVSNKRGLFGEAYTSATGNSLFVVETHTLYEREVSMGERVRVRGHLLGADAKRLHYALEMHKAGDERRAAVQELMALHIGMSARRAAPFPPDRQARIGEIAAAHARLPRPPGLGRRIALPG